MKLLMENWRAYTDSINEVADELDAEGVPSQSTRDGMRKEPAIKSPDSKSDEDQEAALINALADGLKQEHLTRMIQEELLAELDASTRDVSDLPLQTRPRGKMQRKPGIYAGTPAARPERIKSALANLLPGVSGFEDIKKAWSKEELPDADTAERWNRTYAALIGEFGEASPLAVAFKGAQAHAELTGKPDDWFQAAVGSIGRGDRSGLPGGQARAAYDLAREWEIEAIRARVAANAAQQREDEYDDEVLADYDDDAADDADYDDADYDDALEKARQETSWYLPPGAAAALSAADDDDDSGDEILRAIVPEGQRNALAGKNQSVSQFSNLVMEKLGFGEGTPADDKWSEKKTHTLEEEDDQK